MASSSSESHDGHNYRRRRSAPSAVSSQEESAASHTLQRRTVDSDAHTNGGSSSVGVTLTPILTPIQCISLFTLRVHSIGMIRIRISYLRSVRSEPIKGTHESTPGKDSLVLLILIQIIPKQSY